jgi:hypothetical protein
MCSQDRFEIRIADVRDGQLLLLDLRDAAGPVSFWRVNFHDGPGLGLKWLFLGRVRLCAQYTEDGLVVTFGMVVAMVIFASIVALVVYTFLWNTTMDLLAKAKTKLTSFVVSGFTYITSACRW